jgi:acyl-CoA synthetase (NDP forming)
MKSDLSNIQSLLAPRSIVIVGASDRGDKPGARLTRILSESGFSGRIYGTNPREFTDPNVQWFPSISDLPEVPDLACIAVPAEAGLAAFDELSAAGLKAAVIYSSGFSEAGERGRELEAELVRLATERNVAVCGPNTAGLVNFRTGFVGSFTHALGHGHPTPGSVMVVTQSGAVGGILLTHLIDRQVGVSSWISVGNGALLDIAEYLELAADDPDTQVVALFIEGLRDGTAFLEAVRRCRAAGKQVVVFKAGTSSSGSKAAASHTGKLTGSDAAYDGAFAQAGVVRVRTIRELVDMSQFLAWCKPTKLARGAIVSVSGAGCTVMADEFDHGGLGMSRLSDETIAGLAALLPAYSQQGNPIDLTGVVLEHPDRLEGVIRLVIADPDVDFMTLTFATNNRADIAEVVDRAWDRSKPLLVIAPVAERSASVMHDVLVAKQVPVFRDLSDAARVLAAFADHDLVDAAHSEPAAPAAEEAWLTGHESLQTLIDAGLPVAPTARFTDLREARDFAERLATRVVLKADHPAALHKTELGLVKVGLMADEVIGAGSVMAESIGNAGHSFAPHGGYVVQALVSDGTEILVGHTPDETFGHVLTVGVGGTMVEVLHEVASRVVPASADDVLDAIESSRLGRMLRDNRTGPRDTDALVDLVLGFQEHLRLHPEVAEAELNPVMVLAKGEGAVIVDARIRVEG